MKLSLKIFAKPFLLRYQYKKNTQKSELWQRLSNELSVNRIEFLCYVEESQEILRGKFTLRPIKRALLWGDATNHIKAFKIEATPQTRNVPMSIVLSVPYVTLSQSFRNMAIFFSLGVFRHGLFLCSFVWECHCRTIVDAEKIV